MTLEALVRENTEAVRALSAEVSRLRGHLGLAARPGLEDQISQILRATQDVRSRQERIYSRVLKGAS